MTDEKLVRQLLRMILTAQKEVEILHRLVGGYVALPPGVAEKTRQAVSEDFAPLMRTVDDAPEQTLLDMLRKFEGTVQ